MRSVSNSISGMVRKVNDLTFLLSLYNVLVGHTWR